MRHYYLRIAKTALVTIVYWTTAQAATLELATADYFTSPPGPGDDLIVFCVVWSDTTEIQIDNLGPLGLKLVPA
jgi:hypothetical protein